MSVFATVLAGFAGLVGHLADLLEPLSGSSATAVAIVLFTALIRLLVHPLARAAARGQRAKAALAPRIAELRKVHRRNPERLQRDMLELYAKERVSPLAGCLPSLLQIPAFLLLYQLFSRTSIDGEANALLSHRLLTAPLGARWTDALGDSGPFGTWGLVYVVLFATVAAVATFTYRRARRTMAADGAGTTVPAPQSGTPGLAAVTKFMPLTGYLTLVTVAVVPLAAALYVVTSSTWTAAERALLYRDTPDAADGTAASAAPRAT